MDTVRFQFRYDQHQYSILDKALRSMNGLIEKKYQNTNISTISAHNDSWYFTLTPNYLYGKGSLPQLLYGTNFIVFNINDVSLSIEKLKQLLDLDISNAKVTRLDFGYNMVVNHSVPIYLKLLGHKAYCKPSTYGSETLKFNGKGEEYIFYDKIAQTKSNGEHIPEQYADKHVLRYEMKLMNRVAKKLGYETLTVADLASEPVYQAIKNKWYNEYVSIDKLSFNIPNFGKNVKQYRDYLMTEAIERKGLAIVYNEVDAIFRSDYKVKSRIKLMLKKLADRAKGLVANVAAIEFEDKMSEIMEVVY